MHPVFTRTLALACLLAATVFPARAQITVGTAFTYQGSLNDGGSAANGPYDFEISLWNADTGGAQLGATQTLNAVSVTDGLFNMTLDFGSEFNGEARWLEIAVQASGGGGFTTLAPRVELKPVPYALSVTNQIAIGDPFIGTGSTNSIFFEAGPAEWPLGLVIGVDDNNDPSTAPPSGLLAQVSSLDGLEILGIQGHAVYQGTEDFVSAGGFRQVVGVTGQASAFQPGAQALAVGLAGIVASTNGGANVGLFTRADKGGLVDAGVASFAGMRSNQVETHLLGLLLSLGGTKAEVGGLFSASGAPFPAADALMSHPKWAIYATGPVGLFGLNPASGGELPVVVDAATGELRQGTPGVLDLDADPANEIQDIQSVLTEGSDGGNLNLLNLNNLSIGRPGVDSNGALHVTGNTNNVAHFHTASPNRTTIWFTNQNTGEASPASDGFVIGLAGNENAYLENLESTDMQFILGSIPRVTILNGGDVGIGTTNPTEKLEVNGNVVATRFAGDGITPVGGIIMWGGGATPPAGWLICDGATFSGATYPALQAILGGTTLPDLRGRFPVGPGDAPGELGPFEILAGATGGKHDHVLTQNQMPTHTHGPGSLVTETMYKTADVVGDQNHRDGSDTAFYNDNRITGNTGPAGGGLPHNNLPPYYGVHFIIRAR